MDSAAALQNLLKTATDDSYGLYDVWRYTVAGYILGSTQKHLAGRHDQSEHGRTKPGKPDLVTNNKVPIEKQKEYYDMVVSASVNSKVRRNIKKVEVLEDSEINDRLGRRRSSGTKVAGYYERNTGTIVINASVSQREARATAHHEVGHVVEHVYPSFRSGFMIHSMTDAREERREITRTMKSLGYRNIDIESEMFAEMHALAHTPAGRKKFPKSTSWLLGKD